jgi:hypothetical protein
MRDQVQHTQTFDACDAGGRRHVLLLYRESVHVGLPGDENTFAPGLRSLKTADGEAVTLVAKRVYELAGGARLTSDDPEAP